MGASSGCCSEMVSACVGCVDVDSSFEVDGCRSAVLTSVVSFLFDAFFPGLYFLPLIARWSFFSATAKTLATRNCVTLELKSFFLIKKCAAAAKHLVGSLVSSLANFGWNGHGSIKLQQFSSLSSSGVSLSFSNLSSDGADKCGGIFNWMMGLTACCNTNVNCSGEDTSLTITTCFATSAKWLWAS